MHKVLLLLSTIAALGLAACSDNSDTSDMPRLSVFIQTNDAAANAVVGYGRGEDGRLTARGTYPTGGRGSGIPRLGSQGSVLLSEDERWLLVADVGSHEISVFSVGDDTLMLSDRVPSGGQLPYSLTLRGDLLYVLNAGGSVPGGSDNITAFRLSAEGSLSPVPNSTRPLSADSTEPAQVQFSPDGGTLVVTEKATDKIDTYAVGPDGLATGPTVHQSSGDTPFGFAFTSSGYFVVTEAFDKAMGLAAASSYRLGGAGIEAVSGTVQNGETDVCWTVITQDDRYAFITNFGSGTLSSYGIGSDGTLILIEAVAARTSAALGPRDQDLSADGRYLYVIDVGTQLVSGYEVESDGSLTAVGEVGGLPPTIAGLAAR